MKFSVRHLLLLITLAAVAVAAADVFPTLHGTLLLLALTLILPGALVTAALTGGPAAKACCLPALAPIAFALYCIGWAIGWAVFQSPEPVDLGEWIRLHGRTIKAALLSAWGCGAAAGLVCYGILRMRTRRAR